MIGIAIKGLLASILAYDSFLGIERGQKLYRDIKNLSKPNIPNGRYKHFRTELEGHKKYIRTKNTLMFRCYCSYIIAFVEIILIVLLFALA